MTRFPDAPTPRIRLWLANLWDFAENDEAIFRAEVRTTLLHEIGHVLGWDEHEVEKRGLECSGAISRWGRRFDRRAADLYLAFSTACSNCPAR